MAQQTAVEFIVEELLFSYVYNSNKEEGDKIISIVEKAKEIEADRMLKQKEYWYERGKRDCEIQALKDRFGINETT